MLTPEIIKQWFDTATKEEKDQFVDLVGCDLSYLYMIRNGQRIPTSEIAANIETASHEMARRTLGKLPVIYRGRISKTCNECPFFNSSASCPSEE